MAHAPVNWRNEAEHRRLLANAINQVGDGHTASSGEVTLTASTATTVVTDRRAGVDSVVLFMPLTQNAAVEIGNGTMWVSSRGKETFTITHASNAQSDRDYEYALLGTGRGT